MSNLFNSVSVKKPGRNVFDLSHEVKLSCNMGQLIPILCQDIIPGDKFRVNTEMLCRFAPMLAPIMHRVNVYTHFFFVPNRLLWDDWETFITGGVDGKQMPTFPRLGFVTQGNDLTKAGSLADYFGLPTIESGNEIKSPMQFSALPFRAYQMICNEYYRDQNLDPEIEILKDGSVWSQGDARGRDMLTIRTRCWEKDYFTSALPFAQRGEDVTLPMQGSAPVLFDNDNRGNRSMWRTSNDASVFMGQNRVGVEPNVDDKNYYTNGQVITMNTEGGHDPEGYLNYDPQGTLYADLSNASGATINELRASIRLQEWMEKNARGGSRYIEQILSHFGVVSSDSRLQRPEYLGGGKSPVVISEVLQTSASQESTSPQGNPAGRGISAGNTHQFSRYFEEHGLLIGIMSIVPKPAYQQGLPRQFTKFDKLDFYYPEFAHLGEQEIKNQEIYYNFNVTGVQPKNTDTFGYTPRYAEYKYIPSSVHGDFRTTLNYWHLGRVFNGPPSLSGAFVHINEAHFRRIFADNTDSHKLWIQIYNNIRAIRLMPKYGTPLL